MNNLKVLLLTICGIVFSISNAQTDTLTIRLDSITGAIVNGQAVTHEFQFNSDATDPIHFDFHITNNNGSDKDWMITRKVISQPISWSNYLCWEGLCYPVNPSSHWNSSVGNIPSGDTSVLSVYINSASPNTAHYRYYISSDGLDFVDSVDVVITAVLSANSNSNLEYKLFPNPAKNEITIKSPSFNEVELSIYSISGNLVLQRIISQKSTINISSLLNGSYIYVLKDSETGITIRKKLVILK